MAPSEDNQIEESTRLVLASLSPFRKSLLERLAIPFVVRDHAFDERSVERVQHEELAEYLARAKAKSTTRNTNEVILASDQTLLFGDEIIHKSTCKEEMVHSLKKLSGNTHVLRTAIAIRDRNDQLSSRSVDVSLTMRKLSDQEIEGYWQLDQPLGTCGGYMFEKHGVSLFEHVEPHNESAIQGLPLVECATMLRQVLRPK